jgi:hypothetical protein
MAEKDNNISALQEEIQKLHTTTFDWKYKFDNSNRDAVSLRSEIERVQSEQSKILNQNRTLLSDL